MVTSKLVCWNPSRDALRAWHLAVRHAAKLGHALARSRRRRRDV